MIYTVKVVSLSTIMNKESYNAMMKNNVDAKTPTVEATATDTATKQ